MTLEEKFEHLKNTLKKMDRVLIAFSGGVDSTFLLKTASLSGLADVLAVTGESESMAAQERSSARELAKSMPVRHRIIATHELKDANYRKNPPDRCYFCKKELFGELRRVADEEGIAVILDGSNADDVHDWRPGTRAAREAGVQSPLVDACLTKDEIRELSRTLQLPTWDKPATPCLSSRIPYGQEISAELLDRVNRAELFLRSLNLGELRVRSHDTVARIEVRPDQFPLLMRNDLRQKIVDSLKSMGYTYVTLDLQGFRSGSSNEGIDLTEENSG